MNALINIIMHESKIMLKILTKRMEADRSYTLTGETQFGFRGGMRTTDAVGVLRWTCITWQRFVYLLCRL